MNSFFAEFINLLSSTASSLSGPLQFLLAVFMFLYIIFIIYVFIRSFNKTKSPEKSELYKFFDDSTDTLSELSSSFCLSFEILMEERKREKDNEAREKELSERKKTELDRQIIRLIRNKINSENKESAPSSTSAGHIDKKEKIRPANKKSAGTELYTLDFYSLDAISTYCEEYYQEKILSPMRILINLLPPIGFLGTVIGMMSLFIHEDGVVTASIKSTALGTAMLSTVVALFTYIIFEALILILNKRAAICIKESSDLCFENQNMFLSQQKRGNKK